MIERIKADPARLIEDIERARFVAEAANFRAEASRRAWARAEEERVRAYETLNQLRRELDDLLG